MGAVVTLNDLAHLMRSSGVELLTVELEGNRMTVDVSREDNTALKAWNGRVAVNSSLSLRRGGNRTLEDALRLPKWEGRDD